MLKDMINKGEFEGGYTTGPGSKDQNHKLVLDKLRNTNDPEYDHYRDKRIEPRIDVAEKSPKGSKVRENTAYNVASDRHASMDHLKWAVANGTRSTVTTALDNRNANWRLNEHAFTASISHPSGGSIRDAIRRHPKTTDDLKRRMDEYEKKRAAELVKAPQ
jgi:hypothetical protein